MEMHFQDPSYPYAAAMTHNGLGPFEDDQMLGELSQLYNTLREHETWCCSRPKQLKVEAKQMLIELIPMVNAEAQEDLMESLRTLCSNGINLWQSLRGRKGVWLLASLLGRRSKQQQQQDESIATLISILNAEVNASKWSWIIASAGGLPPLVNILETGSTKAKEDAAIILVNLCTHSKEVRDCVEFAETRFLKNARLKRQMLALNAIWCSHKGQLQPSLQDVSISLEHQDVETPQSKCDKAAYEENVGGSKTHFMLMVADYIHKAPIDLALFAYGVGDGDPMDGNDLTFPFDPGG